MQQSFPCYAVPAWLLVSFATFCNCPYSDCDSNFIDLHWYWLVVWNIFYFPIDWVANHPNWLSYFSEGWPNHQPVVLRLKDVTTNQTSRGASHEQSRVFGMALVNRRWSDFKCLDGFDGLDACQNLRCLKMGDPNIITIIQNSVFIILYHIYHDIYIYII